MAVVQLDEVGPVYLGNSQGSAKVWILVAVEVVTRLVHLISMKNQSTISFIASLEILQSRRGCLTKIVVDAHSSHGPLETPETTRQAMHLESKSETLQGILQNNERNVLQDAGISVVIAEGLRHTKVGLAENTVFNVKKALVHLFPNQPNFLDLFELNHKLSLIEAYLNNRPTFAVDHQYMTPHVFRVASLKRSSKEDNQVISDLIFPKNKDIRSALYLMTQNSRAMLNGLAADLSARILNYKNISSLNIPGQGSYVYLADRIVRKKYESLHHALALVTHVQGRTLTCRLSSGQIVIRNVQDVLTFERPRLTATQ